MSEDDDTDDVVVPARQSVMDSEKNETSYLYFYDIS